MIETETTSGTVVKSKHWKNTAPPVRLPTVIIYLCDKAWEYYNARRWVALDRHRATCCECWRKEAE
jgi:hypothetical protein